MDASVHSLKRFCPCPWIKHPAFLLSLCADSQEGSAQRRDGPSFPDVHLPAGLAQRSHFHGRQGAALLPQHVCGRLAAASDQVGDFEQISQQISQQISLTAV